MLGVSIDRNGCSVLIFKEIPANDASALQAAPKNQTTCGFSEPRKRLFCLLAYPPR